MGAAEQSIEAFLSAYDPVVQNNAHLLREMLLSELPDILEEVDLKASMIGYSYGPKYADLICVLIPSKKGLKLGFNRGTQLPDPDKLLESDGKISRYVKIISFENNKVKQLKILIKEALKVYKLY